MKCVYVTVGGHRAQVVKYCCQILRDLIQAHYTMFACVQLHTVIRVISPYHQRAIVPV